MDIFGPENITFDQVAAIVGETIGKPVSHVQIPPDALKAALTSAGISADLAAELVELQQAMSDGLLHARVGDLQWKGRVKFTNFAQEVIEPGYRQATAAA